MEAVILIAVGVAAGYIAGLMGVGGGVLMVPVLALGYDLTQHQAEATSLAVILPTAILSSYLLRRKGIGDLETALKIGVCGMVGAVAGSELALARPARTLQIIFAVFMVLIGVQIIRRGLAMPKASRSPVQQR
jgi:uncharacterized membrane protein YfcA